VTGGLLPDECNNTMHIFYQPLIKTRGPDQFSHQILKFLAESLAASGQKKGVPNPNFTLTQESPTLTPLPPLAKIGHQLYHGGGSISFDATLTKKCPRQRITYPLVSMLTWAFLFKHCFCCKTASFTLKNRFNNDDNCIIFLATF
jgi:hypothetical protein